MLMHSIFVEGLFNGKGFVPFVFGEEFLQSFQDLTVGFRVGIGQFQK